MAAQKTGLGRGLDALLDPYSAAPEDPQATNAGVLMVNVREIDNNALQPRKSFDEHSLGELADSIRVHGIVQPLIVKKKIDNEEFRCVFEVLLGKKNRAVALLTMAIKT